MVACLATIELRLEVKPHSQLPSITVRHTALSLGEYRISKPQPRLPLVEPMLLVVVQILRHCLRLGVQPKQCGYRLPIRLTTAQAIHQAIPTTNLRHITETTIYARLHG